MGIHATTGSRGSLWHLEHPHRRLSFFFLVSRHQANNGIVKNTCTHMRITTQEATNSRSTCDRTTPARSG